MKVALGNGFIVVKGVWSRPRSLSFDYGHFHVSNFDPHEQKVDFANDHVFQMVPKMTTKSKVIQWSFQIHDEATCLPSAFNIMRTKSFVTASYVKLHYKHKLHSKRTLHYKPKLR